MRNRQFKSDDPSDPERATERGWAHKLDPSRREEPSGVHKMVLGSIAGFVLAHKSANWRRHLAENADVRFILSANKEKVVRNHKDDDKVHKAGIPLVAGGGWTPSLLPEPFGFLELISRGHAEPDDEHGVPRALFYKQNFPIVA